MYGLPSTFDPSCLVGCTLQQVSFTANTVNLSFDRDVSITIESSFSHFTQARGGEADRRSVPVLESGLMQLVESSIEAAEGDAEGTLTLTFTNGQRLLCFDDTPAYEAYRIRLGSEEIVV